MRIATALAMAMVFAAFVVIRATEDGEAVNEALRSQLRSLQDENDSLKDRVRTLEPATEHFTASLGTAPAHTQLAMKARESI